MAKLTPDPYPTPNYDEYDSIDVLMDREDEILSELRENNELIKFRAADGYAFYRVVAVSDVDDEPVLQHVPVRDAYRIPAAHIRGLRSQDVKSRLNK
jgi:hypothetical protein